MSVAILDFSPSLVLQPKKEIDKNKKNILVIENNILVSPDDFSKYGYFPDESCFLIVFLGSIAVVKQGIAFPGPKVGLNEVHCNSLLFDEIVINDSNENSATSLERKKAFIIPRWIKIAPPAPAELVILLWTPASKQIFVSLPQDAQEFCVQFIRNKLIRQKLIYAGLQISLIYQEHSLDFSILKINGNPLNMNDTLALTANESKSKILKCINSFLDYYPYNLTKFYFEDAPKLHSGQFKQAPLYLNELIVGYDDQIRDLEFYLSKCFDCHFILHGILLYGPESSGKRSLVKAAISNLTFRRPDLEIQWILCQQFDAMTFEETQLYIIKSLNGNRPRVIVLESLDFITSADGSSNRDDRILYFLLYNLKQSVTDRVIIGLVDHLEGLSPAIEQPNCFDLRIDFKLPNINERKTILVAFLQKNQSVGFSHISAEEWQQIGLRTHGMSTGMLKELVDRVTDSSAAKTEISLEGLLENLSLSCSTSLIKISLDNFFDEIEYISKRNPRLQSDWHVDVTPVYWTDIGGQAEAKQLLRESIEWPIKFPDRFIHFGISPPKGLLLYGPPGNSKTLLAKALATESKLHFLAVKGPQLLNKWVGASEKALREVFVQARSMSPTILFFDEIDAIAGRRGSDGSSSASGVGDRLLTQLLIELDGLQPLQNVIFVAATNRPDILDPALRRPGRLDRLVYVGMPDFDARREILAIASRKMNSFSSEISLDDFAVQLENYSGAEIVAICQTAGLIAMTEDPKTATKIEARHISSAISVTPPRTRPELLLYYSKFSQQSRQSL